MKSVANATCLLKNKGRIMGRIDYGDTIPNSKSSAHVKKQEQHRSLKKHDLPTAADNSGGKDTGVRKGD